METVLGGGMLAGAYKDLTDDERTDFDGWLEEEHLATQLLPTHRKQDRLLVACNLDLAAHYWSTSMKKIIRKRKKITEDDCAISMDRNIPIDDPNRFSLLMTGEKKIGKTALAISGQEEYVFQYDVPQTRIKIREVYPNTWRLFRKFLANLTALEPFPFTRIIVDGTGEWFNQCQEFTCKHFGVEHPSDEGYARAWHFLRDEFTSAVNELMRLQLKGCGVWFIAHAEWKEKKIKGGEKVDRLVPNLSGRCEEIVNSKVDGWFTYDFDGDDRIMVLLGNEYTGGGHRVDGQFLTTTGERVREVYLGTSAKESAAQMRKAFHNELEYASMAEIRKSQRKEKVASRKKKVVRRKKR